MNAKPNLAHVLAAVCPGRVQRIHTTLDQRRQLNDPDGRLGLHVIRHHLGARHASVDPATPRHSFPLTEHAFQAVARKLGTEVGVKRTRAILRRLIAARVLEPAGSYRQPNGRGRLGGFRVTLYRVAVAAARRSSKRPVGRAPRVKRPTRPRWWQHPLFGDAEGRPPPGIAPARLRQMFSADELLQARRA